MQAINTSTAGADCVAVLPSDLLTAREAATRLRTSKAALYEWLARGEIRSYRVGRLVRIRETDLASYLERNRREPPAHPSRYARRSQA